MLGTGYKKYQSTNIGTADRGKLILMIYDHCLKWCRIAQDHLAKKETEKYCKAIFKIQDGITELTCSLDFDAGGEIANNLYRLYTFYNRHLTQAMKEHSGKPIQEVADMMKSLRAAWAEAIEIVRKENPHTFQDVPTHQIKMVG